MVANSYFKALLYTLHSIVVIFLVSCSKDSSEEGSGVKIIFYPALAGHSSTDSNIDSKSSSYTTSNLDEFGVYAYSGTSGFNPLNSACTFMQNLKIYKPNGYGGWIYDNDPKIWPYKNKISFFAYAPYIPDSGDEFIKISYLQNKDSKGAPVISCDQSAHINRHRDLLLSVPLYDMEQPNNGQVKINFIHALSKFEFYAKTSEAVSDSREYSIEKISFEYVAYNGIFKYPASIQSSVSDALNNYSVIPNYEELREYILLNTDYIIDSPITKSDGKVAIIRDNLNFFLIPQLIDRDSENIKDVKITVIYSYTDDEDVKHTLTIQNNLSGILRGLKSIEICKRYKLTFVLSELSGDFNIDTEILPWDVKIIDVPSFD